MKKRVITVLTALCISVSLLGCGDSGNNNTSNINTTGAAKQEATTTTTETSSYKPKSSREGLCGFKNSDGTQTCTNKATRGQLCEYHFNMLNDTYNEMVGN